MVKRLLVLVSMVGVLTADIWYQVRIPLQGNELPAVLHDFEITGFESGSWVQIVTPQWGLDALSDAGLAYEIQVEDMEAYYASQMSGTSNFGDYYTYSEANDVLDSLHERYPDLISERVVLPNDESDETYMGNYVWAVKVSDNVGTEEDEPEVLFTGLHHAREPIGVSICVEWTRWLLDNYGDDPLATYFVDNRQIWIVPMVNPDGYLYNEESYPEGGGMHRKNRRPTSPENPGVDVNRNYTYMWGYDDQGSSSNPRSDSYRGQSAGSEAETQSVMALCKEHQFITALNFHSYSNLFIYPWGYKAEKCEDSAAYFGWGEVATRGCHYVVTPGAGLYPTNGDSDDWMYGEVEEKNRILAVTPEVGESFWQEGEIQQHIKETRPMLIATAKAAGAYPELLSVAFSDGGDGVISAGETIDLTLVIHNMSVQDPSGGLEIELESADSRVQLVKGSITIPSIAPQAEADNLTDPLQVKLSDSVMPDSAIPLTLKIATATEEFIYKVALPVGDRQTLLSDDFEGSGFTSSEWSTTWGTTNEYAHSGKYSITDSPYTGYPDETATYTESPKMDLSEKISAELSFWHRFSIQREHLNEEGQDWGVLEIKYKGIEDWITLKRFNGFQPEWLKETFDLSSVCGNEDFQVRFGLVSDISVHLDGWYLDDISVSAFKGALSEPSGACELVDIRTIAGPVESITTGVLNFTGSRGLKIQVAVFDESGRQVANVQGSVPFSWNMKDKQGNNLPPGVYFVQTTHTRGETRRKVVVVD